jgi:hypothetical protein
MYHAVAEKKYFFQIKSNDGFFKKIMTVVYTSEDYCAKTVETIDPAHLVNRREQEITESSKDKACSSETRRHEAIEYILPKSLSSGSKWGRFRVTVMSEEDGELDDENDDEDFESEEDDEDGDE